MAGRARWSVILKSGRWRRSAAARPGRRRHPARLPVQHPHPRPGYLLLDNVAVLPAAQGQGNGIGRVEED